MKTHNLQKAIRAAKQRANETRESVTIIGRFEPLYIVRDRPYDPDVDVGWEEIHIEFPSEEADNA